MKLPESVEKSNIGLLFSKHQTEIIKVLIDSGYTLIDDGYIGSGGFGIVSRILDSKGKTSAVKIILSNSPLSSEENKNMANQINGEIESLKRFDKIPQIIKMITSIAKENFVLILMEYCPNGSLAKYVEADQYDQLTFEQIKTVMYTLVIGLNEVHNATILHRDLKPENILIGKDGMVKIADFGLAVDTSGNSKLSQSCGSHIAGTNRYLSPEVINGGRQSKESDIWAIGIILIELIFMRSKIQNAHIHNLSPKFIRKMSKTSNKNPPNELIEFASRCLDIYGNRQKADQLLKNQWFANIRLEPIFQSHQNPHQSPIISSQHQIGISPHSKTTSKRLPDDSKKDIHMINPEFPKMLSPLEVRHIELMKNINKNINDKYGYLHKFGLNNHQKFQSLQTIKYSTSLRENNDIIQQLDNCVQHDNGITFENMSFPKDDNFWDSLATSLTLIPHLKILNFSSCPLNHYAIASLSMSISSLTNLIDISLRDCSLSEDRIPLFLENISKLSSLITLDLSRNEIQESGCKYLSDSFKYISNLKRLDLSFDNLNEQGISFLSYNMKYLVQLQDLLLDGNNINDSSITKVLQNFQYLPHLKLLFLEKTNITDHGMKNLCVNLKYITMMTELRLSNNNLLDTSLYCLMKHLNCLPRLNYLSIGKNSFTEICVTSLAEHFKLVTGLVSLQLNDLGLSDNCMEKFSHSLLRLINLENLCLNNNKFGNTGMRKLSKVVTKFSKLKMLLLHSNEIGDEGFQELFPKLTQLPHLKKVSFDNNLITRNSLNTIKSNEKYKEWDHFSIDNSQIDANTIRSANEKLFF